MPPRKKRSTKNGNKSQTKLKSPKLGKHDTNRASTPEHEHEETHASNVSSVGLHLSKNASANVNCLVCHLPVLELATQCDRCKSYVHIDCDPKMNHEIYNVLAKYPDNTLIYFCTSCQPKIYEYANVELYLDQALKRLDNVINETHAAQEFQMDLMVKAFTARVGSLESISSDLREQQSTFIERMAQMEAIIHQLAQPNPIHNQALRTTTFDPSIQPRDQGATTDEPHDRLNTNQNPVNQSTNHSTQASVPTDSQTPQLGTPPNIHYMWSAISMMSHQYPLPPEIPNSSPMRPHATQNSNHVRYQGPPLTRQTFKPPDPPNPETSIVVYNIPTNCHPYQAISELATECHMIPSDIVSVQRLPTSRANPPVAVTCSDTGTKWFFMRKINTKESPTYAKPFLSDEERRKDRLLVSTLKSIREHNPGHTFKISRGKIYEVVDRQLVEHTANSTESR